MHALFGHILCFILLFNTFIVSTNGQQEQYERDIKMPSIINTINSGLKFAHDYLGSESTAMKVANFVVQSFKTMSSKPTSAFTDRDDYRTNTNNMKQNTITPLKSIVKLFGLESNQISAVVINFFIFFANMVSTFFEKKEKSNLQNIDINGYILNKNSKKLQDLLYITRNESLPDMFNNIITERIGPDNSCVQLLFCKLTPFIKKMQETVFGPAIEHNSIKMDDRKSFVYRHLPSTDEFNKNGKNCENIYKECDLNE